MTASSARKETANRKYWKWMVYATLMSFVGFVAFSLLSFFVLSAIKNGLSAETFKILNVFSFSVFSYYAEWFKDLISSFDKLMLIPFGGIAATVMLVVWFVLTCPVKGKKVSYFPSLEEVQETDILGGGLLSMGRLDGEPVKGRENSSALVFFDKGLGKTTSVAIPSILDADEANVVAVDCSGLLAKFTSGHRAKIGKVFNFNWDKLDNPSTGEIYPRWNPLSEGNMPKKGQSRNNYIKFVSQYLVIKDASNYWERLASTTLEALLMFFAAKIEQAMANDYFLGSLIDNGKLSEKDKDLLLSYYSFMPKDVVGKVISDLKANRLTEENYVPVGSWYNVPELWCGKELCLPMIVDTLLHKFCAVKEIDESKIVWRGMLDEFATEAALFGYNPQFLPVFDYVYNMSRKQRWVVFSVIMDSLAMFRKPSIRERTSFSDFSVHNVRGMRDEETGEMRLVTVYSGAYTKESAFMTSFFVDMLMGANLNWKNNNMPLMFVFDDFELLPRMNMLGDLLNVKEDANISSMFLTNEIDDVESVYNKNILRELIKKTTYKLMSAENNKNMINKLGELSVYDDEANQINEKSGINSAANPQMAFKSHSFYMLSKDLQSAGMKNEFAKGKYLLLAQGNYDFPIRLDSMFFAKNPELKEKAAVPEVSGLSAYVLSKRNVQDIEVPNMLDVVNSLGVDISSVKELNDYLAEKKNSLTENISKIRESDESRFEFSNKWQSVKKQKSDKLELKSIEEDDNWWLGENAFGDQEKNSNPFEG